MPKHNNACQWSYPGMTPSTPYEYTSEQPPSITVVEAIANLEEVDPTDLDFTLYNHIQPKALDTLTQSGAVTVTFSLAQYKVHITESNTVRITLHCG